MSATRGPRSSWPPPTSSSTPGAATRSSPTRQSGTFLRDAQAGAFVHKGQHFDIEGQFNVPRSPQGRPVIFQAGDSDEGREFAAAGADAIFSRYSTLQGRPGVLHRRQGPPRHVRPQPRPAADPARRDLRARRHRRRGAGGRPVRYAASRSAVPPRSSTWSTSGTATCPRTTRTARCPTSTRTSARTPSPAAARRCGCTATRWPPPVSGASGRPPTTGRSVTWSSRPATASPSSAPRPPSPRRSTTSSRRTPPTASSSFRTSPPAASTASPTPSSRCSRSAASSARSTRARPCATTSGLAHPDAVASEVRVAS